MAENSLNIWTSDKIIVILGFRKLGIGGSLKCFLQFAWYPPFPSSRRHWLMYSMHLCSEFTYECTVRHTYVILTSARVHQHCVRWERHSVGGFLYEKHVKNGQQNFHRHCKYLKSFVSDREQILHSSKITAPLPHTFRGKAWAREEEAQSNWS